MWIRRLFSLAVLACATALAASASAAPAQDDPVAGYRERFQQGMDSYRQGSFGDAIAYWEPIYSELGAEKGYRLAYDLGVAYAESGDATRGAERLGAFVAETEARRDRREAEAPIVAKEEADARTRLAALTAAKGRVHIDPGGADRASQIDGGAPRLAAFLAWVAPGDHRVTFDPGTPDAVTVNVHVGAGEITDATAPPRLPPTPSAPPPAALPASPTPTPTPTPTLAAAPTTARDAAPPPRPRTSFLPVLMAVTGGLTIAATIAAVPLEAHASTLHDRFVTEQDQSPTHTIAAADRQSFADARTLAYAAVGGAIGFAAVTAACAGWFVLGTPSLDGAAAAVAPERRGASLHLSVRF